MFRFFLLLLFFASSIFAQDHSIDPNRLDSLKRVIENNRKNIREEQELVLKKQDSLLRAAQNSIIQNKSTNPAPGHEETGTNKEKTNQVYLVLVLALLAGIILFITLLRKKNRSFPRLPKS